MTSTVDVLGRRMTDTPRKSSIGSSSNSVCLPLTNTTTIPRPFRCTCQKELMSWNLRAISTIFGLLQNDTGFWSCSNTTKTESAKGSSHDWFWAQHKIVANGIVWNRSMYRNVTPGTALDTRGPACQSLGITVCQPGRAAFMWPNFFRCILVDDSIPQGRKLRPGSRHCDWKVVFGRFFSFSPQ